MNPSISIVISFYKRYDLLVLILNSITSQLSDDVIIEIIIVDSYSVPNLSASIHSLYSLHKSIITILNCQNRLSSKRNAGIRSSKYDYISFLDDDCIPTSNYILDLIESILSVNSTPLLLNGSASFPVNSIHSDGFIRFRQYLLGNSLPYLSHVKSHNAFAMNFCGSSGFLKQNLFDEKCSGYGWEDSDFFVRAIQHVPIIQGSFHVIHMENSSFINYINKCIQSGAALYKQNLPSFKVNSSPLFRALVNALFFRNICKRLPYQPILYLILLAAKLLDYFRDSYFPFQLSIYRLLYLTSFLIGALFVSPIDYPSNDNNNI